MRIGTTPTHHFTLPFGVEMVEEVEITYHQNGQEVLKKWKEHCVLEDNTVSVTLTQEETFFFDDAANVEIQIRVLTTGGNALASDVMCVSCARCLSDEVLT